MVTVASCKEAEADFVEEVAVVRAASAALDQIAVRPEVWAMDPAREVMRVDQTAFLAP
ncbi:MAG TPA: hypothetical protein VFC19_37230 [Candidatus Limnocylindrales bacterium]|nr:hypothetical protein [Candidatus Limnocylindrales bacterium]